MIIKADAEIYYTPEDGVYELEVYIGGKSFLLTQDEDIVDLDAALHEVLKETYKRYDEEQRAESKIAAWEIDNAGRRD